MMINVRPKVIDQDPNLSSEVILPLRSLRVDVYQMRAWTMEEPIVELQLAYQDSRPQRRHNLMKANDATQFILYFNSLEREEHQKDRYATDVGEFMKMWQTTIKNDENAMPSLYEILDGLHMFYCCKLEDRFEGMTNEMVYSIKK